MTLSRKLLRERKRLKITQAEAASCPHQIQHPHKMKNWTDINGEKINIGDRVRVNLSCGPVTGIVTGESADGFLLIGDNCGITEDLAREGRMVKVLVSKDLSTPTNCPFCGDTIHQDPACGSFYACNTLVNSTSERGRKCLLRELAAKDREIAELRSINTELLEALNGLENAAPEKGLNGFTDKGQQTAYRFGWAHAIQEASAAIAKAEENKTEP